MCVCVCVLMFLVQWRDAVTSDGSRQQSTESDVQQWVLGTSCRYWVSVSERSVLEPAPLVHFHHPKKQVLYHSYCCWELTSESRHKRERRPFHQESVGGWRKDEVQWMSLALPMEGRTSGLKVSAPISLVECTFVPFRLRSPPELMILVIVKLEKPGS